MWLTYFTALHSYLVTQIVCLDHQLFSTPGKEVHSKVLKKDIDLTGDASLNLLDGNGKEPTGTNQQFGYYVDLVSLPLTNYSNSPRGEFYIHGAEPDGLAAVSAPGSPDLKSTTAGFVELHSHNYIPITNTHAFNADKEERVFLVLYPNISDLQDAHSMFGHSFSHVQAISKSGSKLTEVWMHTGAPQTATCGPKDPNGRDGAFQAVGRVFEHKIYDRLRGYGDFFGQKVGHSLDGTCVDDLYDSEKEARKGYVQFNRNELGFSVHKSTDELFILVGAPLFSAQGGTVEIYRRESVKDVFKKFPTSWKVFYLCADKDAVRRLEDFSYKDQNTGGKQHCEQNDLTFGYSVGSASQLNEPYLIAGGPRAESLRGKIKIFQVYDRDIFSNSTNKTEKYTIDKFEFLDPLVGSGFNTGFGTTVVGANFGEDDNQQLVVGEPYYTDPISGTINSGRVSIYYVEYSWGKRIFTLVYSFFSPAPYLSNMFGFKVATVGDLDDDGYEDLLVTALNETTHEGKGRGKVYIFCGKSLSGMFFDHINENRLKQPIILQEFTVEGSNLFGFSIGESRVDLDGNGFNDLIIGDPGKESQFARVYYKKTYIRLFSNFDLWTEGCPKELQEKKNSNYSCYSVRIYFDNFGSRRRYSNYKQNRYRDSRYDNEWSFQKNFTVEVTLNSIETLADYVTTSLKVYNQTQKVTLGPYEFWQHADFWIYDESPGSRYVESIILNASLTLVSGDKVDLGREYANAPTVLDHVHLYQHDLFSGERIEVEMKALQKEQHVFLEARHRYLDIPIRFEKQPEWYWLVKDPILVGHPMLVGELQIFLDDAPIRYSTVSSDPPNLLSCTQLDYCILCKFYNGKTFTTADVVITVSISEVATDLYHKERFFVGYRLNWANSFYGSRYEDSIIQLHYHNIHFLEKTPETFLFKNGEKFELHYNIVFTDHGHSKTVKFKVILFVPYDPSKLEIIGTPEECRKLDQRPISSEGNCSSETCQKYECIVLFSEGHDRERKLHWQISLLNGNYTNAVVAKEKFRMEMDYEIIEDVVLKAAPRSESVASAAEVYVRTKNGQWWAVLIAFFASILLVVAAIFILLQIGFFATQSNKKNVASAIRKKPN